ncbi:MAG: hypothetical protein WCP66_06215, partial [Methylococcales bacterium]
QATKLVSFDSITKVCRPELGFKSVASKAFPASAALVPETPHINKRMYWANLSRLQLILTPTETFRFFNKFET